MVIGADRRFLRLVIKSGKSLLAASSDWASQLQFKYFSGQMSQSQVSVD